MTKKYREILSAVWMTLILCAFVFCPKMNTAAWAAFGEDIEKPKPEFTREGDRITAKYIPRAKSTSVLVHFTVEGGKLIEVKGMDFEKADRPEVDIKNFKSALFTIEIGEVKTGAEATVTISSQFFTSSTQYYVFNERLPKPWMVSDCQNISLPDRVQDLLIKVKDGGPYDSDGEANGRIFFVGGPRDSFWGYALGTLFIRFFGIFLVLGILMTGMLVSGRIFQRIEKTKAAPVSPVPEPVKTEMPKTEFPKSEPEPEPVPDTAEEETAAAIAMALHLHLCASKSSSHHCEMGADVSDSSAWAQEGRVRMMGERLQMYQRKDR